jgi:tetratricopeptide (TPR) repeat protein
LAEEGLEATSVAEESTFDIGSVANHMFADLALLPTRLTAYNSHDDAAVASYTCCHPDQEEDIERALKANADFVNLYPTSDFSDDALFHSGYVNSVKRDMLHQMAAFTEVVRNYPDSDLWDDAAWNLAKCYERDKDRPAQIQVLEALLARRPYSVHADDACLSLAQAFMDLRDEEGALHAFETLATAYRTSEYCDDALYRVAAKYQTLGSYEQAIAGYEDLLATWPMSDYVDDAQIGIAECLRAMYNRRDALTAYQLVIRRMPGSPQVRKAMTEVNNLIPDSYDLKAHYPCDDAQDLIDLAQHYQNYRQFSDAIAAYRDFIRQFRGHDFYDDAWFRIGVCYQQMNRLFQKINEAKGPDELFKLQDDFSRGTGGLSTIPTDRELSAVQDAVGAFAVVVNNLIGSNLRDEALREIAKSYEHSNKLDEAAFTYQEKVVHFPYETEPDEGDMRGKGALCKTLRWYADPKNHPAGEDRYKLLARAYPDVFPPELYDNREQFLALMKLYLGHAEHSFYEMKRHIPYRLSMDDLKQDARFYQACLNMQQGYHKAAAKLLKPFLSAPTSDFAAPGAYVYARAEELLGDEKSAAEAYQWILDVHPLSGLADDARAGLARVTGTGSDADVQWATQKVAGAVGPAEAAGDVWVGENVVVVAPWIFTAKMLQYNMPNIWDEAQAQLHSWTGATPNGKVVVCLSLTGEASTGGDPVVVSAWQIGDPPRWSLGLTQLAQNAVLASGSRALEQQPTFVAALSKFGAAALQYQLVTETRDTIGSAAAVKLPQEEVLKARESALKALEEYVREEPDPSQLNDSVVAGMLYTLLDANGYSKHSLIDWEPYSRFFEALCRAEGKCDLSDEKAVHNLVVYGMNQAFGTDCCEQFASWGFAVDPARLGALSGRG